jgi:hypothetical protein
MLTEVWAPVWRRFRVRPVPERFLSCDDTAAVLDFLSHPEGKALG